MYHIALLGCRVLLSARYAWPDGAHQLSRSCANLNIMTLRFDQSGGGRGLSVACLCVRADVIQRAVRMNRLGDLVVKSLLRLPSGDCDAVLNTRWSRS